MTQSSENLKLLEPETPVPLSVVRQQLIVSWLDKYREAFDGKKYREPFVKCLGILRLNFEGVDEDTGEILVDYPSIEEWNEEIDKFLVKSHQNWFRANGKCTFYLFCKHYGRFDHHIVPEKKQHSRTVSGYFCKGCRTTHPINQWCEKS